MKFDFSAFKTSPPKGFRVIDADHEKLRLHRKACGRTFTIRKTGEHQFSLYVRSVTDANEDGSFVMRSDLPRLLHLVGYGKDPRATVETVNRLSLS